MTSPATGIVRWAQSGVYAAWDDRQVITALAGRRHGVIRPCTMGPAGTGLWVNVEGPWMGVATAGDGTVCVVSSEITQRVLLEVGGEQPRTDLIRVNIGDPDSGTWVLSASPAWMEGTGGLTLGWVDVPARALLASQFTYRPRAQDFSTGGAIPGPVGPPGQSSDIPGPPGPPGADGPAGRGVTMRDPVPSEPDLPPDGNEQGDLRITLDTGDAWVWSDRSLPPQPGPPGPQGDTGVPGPPGPPVILGTVTSSSQLPSSGNTRGDSYLVGTPPAALDVWTWTGTEWVNSGPMAVGPPGPRGETGTGLRMRQAVPDAASLPPSGNDPGDLRIAEDSGHAWSWDGTTWIDVGFVRGPQGQPGQTGQQGTQGPPGAASTVPGPPGAPGSNGANGTSVRFLASVANQSALPGAGNAAGDLRMADDTGFGYMWTGAAWTLFGAVRGPAGQPGSPGSTGPTGPPGEPGSGITMHPSVPGVGDLPASGNDEGDMRIVEATGDAYVWDGTHWINVGPVRGPAGPPGNLAMMPSVPAQGDLPPSGNRGGDLRQLTSNGDLFVWVDPSSVPAPGPDGGPPPAVIQPADTGAVAWNWNPAHGYGSTHAITGSRLWVARLRTSSGGTVTSINLLTGGGTGGPARVGLYDDAGAFLGGTASNQAVLFTTAVGNKTFPLDTPAAVPPASFVRVAISLGSFTTGPSVLSPGGWPAGNSQWATMGQTGGWEWTYNNNIFDGSLPATITSPSQWYGVPVVVLGGTPNPA